MGNELATDKESNKGMLGRPKNSGDFVAAQEHAWLSRAGAKSLVPNPIEVRHPMHYPANVKFARTMQTEGYTMVSPRRARALLEMSQRVTREGIVGAIVDCGVWNGGSSIMLGYRSPDRQVWSFDSFEGLPKPGDRDTDADGGWEGIVVGSEEKLKTGFARYAGRPERLHVVKGWFHETFPVVAADIGPIALLHVDADFYDPCRLALDTFYDQISQGGFVAVDDLRMWRGAREATDEFRAERRIVAPIRGNYYWRKPK